MSIWNSRYNSAEYLFGTKPNEFLRDQAVRLAPRSRILCIGEGEGRNAVFLAEQGHMVTALDASEVGLEKAKKLASEKGTSIDTIQCDLMQFQWKADEWDAIISIFCHLPPSLRAKTHQGVSHSLKSDGLFLVEAYTPRQHLFKTGGPSDPDMLYTAQLLQADMPQLIATHLHELDRYIEEGTAHVGMSSVVQGIFQKP